MSTVVRYDLVGEYDPFMQQMQEGDYVLYSSYMVLQQQREDLIAALNLILSFDGAKWGVAFDMKSIARKAIAKVGG